MNKTLGNVGAIAIEQDLNDQLGPELKAADFAVLDETLSDQLHRAYALNEAKATREIETLLFRTNMYCGFTNPLQAQPSHAWSRIVRAKLRTALEDLGEQVQELSADELTEALERETAKSTLAAEKLVNAVLDQEDDGAALRIFTKNWFLPGQGFIEWMLSIAHHTSDSVLRRAIIENIEDEIDGEGHKIMRDRFCEAVGIDHDLESLLEDDELCTETISKGNFRIVVNALPEVEYSLGSVYSIEAHTGPVSDLLTKRLRARGFDEKSIETFSLHAGVDSEHAREWLDAILNAPSVDARGRGKALLGAQLQHAFRLKWMQGIANKAGLSVEL